MAQNLSRQTVAQLSELAASLGIDPVPSKKTELIAAIEAKQAEAAAPGAIDTPSRDAEGGDQAQGEASNPPELETITDLNTPVLINKKPVPIHAILSAGMQASRELHELENKLSKFPRVAIFLLVCAAHNWGRDIKPKGLGSEYLHGSYPDPNGRRWSVGKIVIDNQAYVRLQSHIEDGPANRDIQHWVFSFEQLSGDWLILL